MRVGFTEWPDGLEPHGPDWSGITRRVADARLDLLITNELPFGRWLAAEPAFDREAAEASVALHQAGLEALEALPVDALISSRPVWADARLANEAFVIADGEYRALHWKRLLPEEPGWYEATWYAPGGGSGSTSLVAGLRVGVLLCTELMFNEQARRYGRDGADLIAVSRATGESVDTWRTAGRMAAIVSGACVVSSNRVGAAAPGLVFGGVGFAFAPDGTPLTATTSSEPLVVLDVDAAVSARQKASYPCYVQER